MPLTYVKTSEYPTFVITLADEDIMDVSPDIGAGLYGPNEKLKYSTLRDQLNTFISGGIGLPQVLIIDPETGGEDLKLTNGDSIISPSGLAGINFVGGDEIELNADVKIKLNSDLIEIPNTSKIVSGTLNKSQLEFGSSGNEVNITTDGGTGAEGALFLQPGSVNLNRAGYGGMFIDVSANVIDHVTAVSIDAPVINIGSAGNTVNILGSALFEYAANQYVLDKLITLNYNGAAGSAAGVGFEMEAGGVVVGHFKTNAAMSGWLFNAPANIDETEFVFTSTLPRSKTFQDTNGTIAELADISALSSVYQPLDTDLTTIAGLTATTDNFIVSVSSAWASRTPAQVRTTLGLVIGTNVQAWDTDLDTWAAITRATGFDAFVTTPSSASLAALVSDETGSGALVFATAPLFKTEIDLNNPANTFKYKITPDAIVADRILNLPLITGTDTFAVLGLSQTFTGNLTVNDQAANSNNGFVANTKYVDASNVSQNAVYRTLINGCGIIAAGTTAGTFITLMNGNAAMQKSDGSSGTLNSIPAMIHIDSSEHPSVNGVTPKLNIKVNLVTNHVAPTGNFTFGLYPLTSPASSGGANVRNYTVGTVITGSDGAAQATPAADSMYSLVSADFALPADGFYGVCVLTTSTIAANALVLANVSIRIRNT